MTRREYIQKLLQLAGGAVLSGIVTRPRNSDGSVRAAGGGKSFLVEGIGRKPGYGVKELTRKVFEAAGGMHNFVSKGDVVAVKPNISWARPPRFGATTHPAVLEAVVELCQEAGAHKVRIADHTIHDARRCFAISGAGEVAERTGADLVYPRSSLMRTMSIGGRRLRDWPVFVPLIEADKLINLPVAKHHSLSSLTLGMKNWIGGIGGNRWSLHQDIHQSVADLAGFFRPALTMIDAVRIMLRNGPSGGDPGDVDLRNTLILSDDPVAADARAARLFDRQPESLAFIRLAQKAGLGNADLKGLDFTRVTL
jgi:uncharacterized protein (DUF362 family)